MNLSIVWKRNHRVSVGKGVSAVLSFKFCRKWTQLFDWIWSVFDWKKEIETLKVINVFEFESLIYKYTLHWENVTNVKLQIKKVDVALFGPPDVKFYFNELKSILTVAFPLFSWHEQQKYFYLLLPINRFFCLR